MAGTDADPLSFLTLWALLLFQGAGSTTYRAVDGTHVQDYDDDTVLPGVLNVGCLCLLESYWCPKADNGILPFSCPSLLTTVCRLKPIREQ